MTYQNHLLNDIPNRYADPEWLELNAQELYEIFLDTVSDSDQLDTLIEHLVTLMPALITREDVKRWGRLLEQAYLKTPFAKANGLDGETTRDISATYIFRKRPKIPQLPTKTQRHKRVVLRAPEMFEIYLILLLARYLDRLEEMPPTMIDDAMHFARVVSDPWCSNKLHQALGFIFLMREEFDTALVHAHIAYGYWSRHKDTLEMALTTLVMGQAYQNLGEIAAAQTWLERSCQLFSRTDYPYQYAHTTLITARLKFFRQEFDAAVQWAEIAVSEYVRLDSPNHTATAYHILGTSQIYAGQPEDALIQFEKAGRIWEKMGKQDALFHLEHAIAHAEADAGQTQQSLHRLTDLVTTLNAMPESGWRDALVNQAEQMMTRIRDGVDLNYFD